MTMPQMKQTKSDVMAAATGLDMSPDVALQALLAHDLMAFTEFVFGVVRQNGPPSMRR